MALQHRTADVFCCREREEKFRENDSTPPDVLYLTVFYVYILIESLRIKLHVLLGSSLRTLLLRKSILLFDVTRPGFVRFKIGTSGDLNDFSGGYGNK